MPDIVTVTPMLTDIMKIGGGGIGSTVMLLIGMRLLGIDFTRQREPPQVRAILPTSPTGEERRREVILECPAHHSFERLESRMDKLNEGMAKANTYLSIIAASRKDT